MLSFGDPTDSAELARECPEGDAVSIGDLGVTGDIGDIGDLGEPEDLHDLGDCGHIYRRGVGALYLDTDHTNIYKHRVEGMEDHHLRTTL